MEKTDSAVVCFFGTMVATLVALVAIEYGYPYFGVTWGLLLASGSGWLSHGIYRGLYANELFVFGDDWNKYIAPWHERGVRASFTTVAFVAAIGVAIWMLGPASHIPTAVFGEGNLRDVSWLHLWAVLITLAFAIVAGGIVFHVFGTSFKRMVSGVFSAAAVAILLTYSQTPQTLEGITITAVIAGALSAIMSLCQRSLGSLLIVALKRVA